MKILEKIDSFLEEGKFSENDKVKYQGKTWEVVEIEDNGMLVLTTPDEKERVKVLPGEVKKING